MIEHFYKNIPGWFGFKEQYEKMIRIIPDDGVWVELGCYCGKSLNWLMVERHNQHKQFSVHAVDAWPLDSDSEQYLQQTDPNGKFRNFGYDKFKNALRLFEGKYTEHRNVSWLAAQSFENNSIDYVMVDAGHTYEMVIQDLEAWWPKIKPGGYFGGDDYETHGGGVKQAVDEFFSAKNYTVTISPNLKEFKKRDGKYYSNDNNNWLVQK